MKKIYRQQLESLYEYPVASGQLISLELLEALVLLTANLNYEVAVYLNRRGQVEGVALGDGRKVALPELSRRPGSQGLNKLRLLHTHPGGSGYLSSVDIAALNTMGFDCMAAIGVKENAFYDLWVGFIKAGGELGECRLVGPLGAKQAATFDYMELVREVEEGLAQIALPPLTGGRERALLVGVEMKKPQGSELGAKESLKELQELAYTAGAEVIRDILQSREKPDQAFYIGRGLAEEISLLVQAYGIDLVIFDTELSGTQLRNLEELLQCKVLDRTNLILDIFAQRARSREGKIQVELAQLEYLLPRLTGLGTELSRLAGGIGTRGPGETKLEKDRRHIQRRILELKKQLNQVSKQRQVTKAKRDLPLVALVGYTDAGKSTLRYKLLEMASPTPVNWEREDPGTNHLFATLDSTVRGILLPNGQEILVADTVGFIQRLPHQLISAFKATLEEVQEADLLLHVVDAFHPYAGEQLAAVEQVLGELGVLDKPAIIVFNKVDLLPKEKCLFHHPDHLVVGVSAKTGEGVDRLMELLASHIGQSGHEMELLLPHDEGQLLGLLYREAQVREVDYQAEGIFLKALVPESLYDKIVEFSCQPTVTSSQNS